MDRIEAESVVREALRVSALFDWSAEYFRAVAGDEDWSDYRRAVGRVMGELYVEIMRPIERAYPEFGPLIYDDGLLDEAQFPSPPSTREELASLVAGFVSAVVGCVDRADLALGLRAPDAVEAARQASELLGCRPTP